MLPASRTGHSTMPRNQKKAVKVPMVIWPSRTA